MECSLWLKELAHCNIEGTDVAPDMLPEIFRDSRRFQELFQFPEECNIEVVKELRLRKLLESHNNNMSIGEVLELGNYREASLLEFLTVYTPGFKTNWSNIGKVNMDVRDNENELVPFRRKNQETDEHEEIFTDING